MEVWDVVDVAKKRVKIEGLKTSESGQELAPGLDAEFLDVYQVIFGILYLLFGQELAPGLNAEFLDVYQVSSLV